MAEPSERHAQAVLSTETVERADAFAYWCDLICATFVRLQAEPIGVASFRGRIEHCAVGAVELSTVSADGQHVRRTPRLAAGDREEYLLASIQLAGRGRVDQDWRSAQLEVGDLAFYDSTRPYELHFDAEFEQLVVQVPKGELRLDDTRAMTARTLGPRSPGAAVVAFFRAMSRTAVRNDSDLLSPHAIALLAAAASYAGRESASGAAGEALLREQVLRFLADHLADAELDAESVARACHVSRRTLYRLLGGDPVAARRHACDSFT